MICIYLSIQTNMCIYIYIYLYTCKCRGGLHRHPVDARRLPDDGARLHGGVQNSSKGGAVETGCSDLYDDIYKFIV